MAKAVSQYPAPPTKYYKTKPFPLEPPAPPPSTSESTYTVFGVTYPTVPKLPSLPSTGHPILYNPELLNTQPCQILWSLNHKLLQEYRSFLHDICNSTTNGKVEERIEMIEHLFVNMHHVINCLRPILARGEVGDILEKQRKERERLGKVIGDTIEDVQKEIEHVKMILGKKNANIEDLGNDLKEIAHEDGDNDVVMKDMEVREDDLDKDDKKWNSDIETLLNKIAEDPSLM